MKTSLLTSPYIVTLCVLTALSPFERVLQAQEKSQPAVSAAANPLLGSQLEISKGQLQLSSLGDRVQANDRKSSEPTLQNVVEILRNLYTDANITLAPGMEKIRIGDVKLRLNSMRLGDVLQALQLASGSKFVVRGENASFLLNSTQKPGSKNFEVFNLTRYFQMENLDEKSIPAALDRIDRLILDAYRSLKGGQDAAPEDVPQFQFHSGANLYIVAGEPVALEAAAKILNALQPPASASTTNGSWQKPPPMTEERRAILHKLESIRMASVTYDNLPLGEVVRMLGEESKKLDPEKRGLNFLVNPAQPMTPARPGAPATLPDPVDSYSVSIRVVPPLANLRLIDVLDAVVRVADHPIKYTVTDYAVIFSLRAPEDSVDATQAGGSAMAR